MAVVDGSERDVGGKKNLLLPLGHGYIHQGGTGFAGLVDLLNEFHDLFFFFWGEEEERGEEGEEIEILSHNIKNFVFV